MSRSDRAIGTDLEKQLRIHLSDEQYAVVTDTSPELLCLACAGSGKSRVIAFRAAYLIRTGQAMPSSLSLITFTNKAAASLKERVAVALEALGLPPALAGAMYIGTIDSFAKYLLEQVDADYQQRMTLSDTAFQFFLMQNEKEFYLDLLNGSRYSLPAIARKVMHAWQRYHNEGMTLTDLQGKADGLMCVFDAIQKGMKERKFSDFSLVLRTLEWYLRKSEAMQMVLRGYSHLIVDEYQDVNPIQERLFGLMHRTIPSILYVGDDDQQIYGFRGSEIRNILEFERRYPSGKTLHLGTNYRSSAKVVRLANRLVQMNLAGRRIDKESESARGKFGDGGEQVGVHWFETYDEQIDWVADAIRRLPGLDYTAYGEKRTIQLADITILYRRMNGSGNTHYGPLVEKLEQAGIPVHVQQELRDFRPGFRFQLLRQYCSQLEFYAGGKLTLETLANRLNGFLKPNGFAPLSTETWGKLFAVHSARLLSEDPYDRLFVGQILSDLMMISGIPESADELAGEVAPAVRLAAAYDEVALRFGLADLLQLNRMMRHPDQLFFPKASVQSDGSAGSGSGQAVQLMSVHSAKGLEFPVVFVVDTYSFMDGWLPEDDCLLQASFVPGGGHKYGPDQAFDEDVRIQYTALTRAAQHLWVTGAHFNRFGKPVQVPHDAFARVPMTGFDVQPDWLSRPLYRASFGHAQTDGTGVGQGQSASGNIEGRSRKKWVTSFSDLNMYHRCPKQYDLIRRKGLRGVPGIMEGIGTSLHTVLNQLFHLRQGTIPDQEAVSRLVNHSLYLRYLPKELHPDIYAEETSRAIPAVLAFVRRNDRFFRRKVMPEQRFEMDTGDVFIRGSVDLLVPEAETPDGRLFAEVMDYKSFDQPDPVKDPLKTQALAFQVQLYAHAARQVFRQKVVKGTVDFLKTSAQREVPVGDEAVQSALALTSWIAERVQDQDFPARPEQTLCQSCPVKMYCDQKMESYRTKEKPPQLWISS